jgi:hypothetical protein
MYIYLHISFNAPLNTQLPYISDITNFLAFLPICALHNPFLVTDTQNINAEPYYTEEQQPVPHENGLLVQSTYKQGLNTPYNTPDLQFY